MTEAPDVIDEASLIGGPERRAIVLHDHDPGWAQRFAAERATIAAAVGAAVRRIEHIGSTAVPGLAAKPIVDILLTVDEANDEASYLPALERSGYLLRVREPGHRMLRTPELDVHVHVLADDAHAVEEYLVFRDQLCRSATDRDLYAATKHRLAQHDWPTVNHYAKAKTEVIRQILAHAGGKSDRRRS